MRFSATSSSRKRLNSMLFAASLLISYPLTLPLKAEASLSETNNIALSEAADADSKGLFGDIVDLVTGGKDGFCLPIIGCVDVGSITEDIVMEQLEQLLAKENAPIAVDVDDAFPVFQLLPGSVFDRPQLLDVTQLDDNTPIPAGDYVIPVIGFCLEQTFGSPNGHRYQLAPMGGTQQNIMADFLSSASPDELDYRTTQGIVWGIRAGMDFDDMPNDMQALIHQVIPQHQKSLKKGSFLKDVREIGDTAVQFLGYNSFESFLNAQGDFGEIISELLTIEETLTQANDWRSLSSRFLNEGTSPIGNIEQTPWSQLAPSTYARFVTLGNAGDVGALMLRVEGTPAQTKASAKNLPSASTMSGADLKDMIGSIAAVPEGSGRVQPLTFQPYPVEDLPVNPDGTVDVAAIQALPLLLGLVEAGIIREYFCSISDSCTSAGEALNDTFSNSSDDSNWQTGITPPPQAEHLDDGSVAASGSPDPQDEDPEEETSYRRIHNDERLRNGESYRYWSRQSDDDIIRSLQDGQRESLKVSQDGRIFNGNTRTLILEERGYNLGELIRSGRIVPGNHEPFSVPLP